MGASRKLQTEIDRVLKKVQEGVEVFDGIWTKVHDTENANQKEKFEADLKKEIKKLQRYRDQIKTWIQSSEIKDKKALMDARKIVEREMERFKVCEKETKTKAFSKDGLGQQPKTDPKEKAKAETRDWLNSMVADLDNEIDSFEAEVEGLSVKKGKSKRSRLAHLETSIARHKAHIMKLELILRLVDNDELSPDLVNDVKDLVEDYVERNQESFDEFNDVDELYSSLQLDKIEVLDELVSRGPSTLVKHSSQGIAAKKQDEDTAPMKVNVNTALRTTPLKAEAMGNSPLATQSGLTLQASASSELSASSMLSAPQRGTIDSWSASVSFPLVNTEDDNNSFIRRGSPATHEMGIPAAHEMEIGSIASLGSSNLPSINASRNFSSVSSIPSSETLSSVPAASEMSQRTILNIDEMTSSDGLDQSMISPSSNKLVLQQTSHADDATSSNDFIDLYGNPVTGGRVFSPSIVSGVQWRRQSGNTILNQTETVSNSSSFVDDIQLSGDTFLTPGQQLQEGHSSASVGVIGRRSAFDVGIIGENLRSLGGTDTMHDRNYNLQMLEAAFSKLPQPKDSELVKNYVPRHPVATPAYYPQTQAEIIENPAFWVRIGSDPIEMETLFFAFYYQQNTYQQYLAARELKRHFWRYHTKYNLWFQRYLEPKITTDEFERGTYVYFDFRFADDNQYKGWCKRIKDDFTFEYSFLEDELVI
ncbi:hypothetical protein HPP92_012145 [Vanilla planifolia]|uniref:CCR4-NOT transcription complex subunit 3 n=1 Tax=Vanilla planifolia TaxID=51239 RepID=A0A835R8F7_VANPL|nr:hypothetical protein HPP92_012145 [Vanilla planifolia]